MRSIAAKKASVWAPAQTPSAIAAHRSARARPRSAGRVSGHRTAAASEQAQRHHAGRTELVQQRLGQGDAELDGRHRADGQGDTGGLRGEHGRESLRWPGGPRIGENPYARPLD